MNGPVAPLRRLGRPAAAAALAAGALWLLAAAGGGGGGWSDEAAVLHNHGLADLAAERLPEAAEAFQAALEAAPADAVEPRFNLALSRYRERRYEEALAALDGLLGKGEVAARAQVLRAGLLRALGRVGPSVEAWLAAFDAGQLDGPALWDLMGLLRLVGPQERIFDLLDALPAEGAAGTIDTERADVLLAAHRVDEALTTAARAQGLLLPDDAELAGFLDQARDALAGGDPKSARAALGVALNLLRASEGYATGLERVRTVDGVPVQSYEPLEPLFPRRAGPDPGPLEVRASVAVPEDARGLCTSRGGLWVVGEGSARLLAPPPAAEEGSPGGSSGSAGWEAAVTLAAEGASDCLTADLDRDGEEDLVLLEARRVRVLWSPALGDPQEVVLPGAASAVALLDHDLDGDLDLAAAGPDGLQLWRNDRDRTWERLPLPDLQAAPATGLLASDLDGDGAPELLVERRGAPALLLDALDASPTVAELPGSAAGGGVTVADLDGDGRLDLLAAGSGLPAEAAGAAALGTVDLDLDGLPDLVTRGGGSTPGIRVLRDLGSEGFAPWPGGLPPIPEPRDAAVLDLDDDGAPELAVLTAGKLLGLAPSGERAPGLRLRLRAQKDNPDAVGSRIELLAGTLRVTREVRLSTSEVGEQGPRQILGLGGRATGDWLKVVWPNATWSDVTDPTAGPVELEQPVGLVGSCPFLYTWDGERFRFATDLLGGAPLGLPVAPGAYMPTDPEEYVLVPGEHLVERGGRYLLRVTEELREILYLDRVELLAVDRPERVSLATPDGLGPPPFASFRLFAGSDARPPVAARDHRDRDVTGRLAAVDGRYPDGFRPIAFQGFAEDHSVTLRFAPPEDRRRAFLVVTGGYYWSEADGYALSQARRVAPRPPRLEVRTTQGWRTVLDPMPFPGGRPKTVAVDLSGLLPPGDGPVELRISSNLRLYFDRILLATDRGDELPLYVRPLRGTAELRHRGYSAPLPWDGRVPQAYDYERTVPGRPFPRFEGFYTRFGDVTPLLAETDGELVVVHHGEEVALEFEAPEPPPPGFRRDFLLHLVGWDKDGDPKIAGGARVEPLPFVGMESYPYHWPERYPWTPEALAVDRATRTRWVPGSSPWR